MNKASRWGVTESINRTIVEGDARPLSERQKEFEKAFRLFVDQGKFKWDAILAGMANFIRSENVGVELFEYVYKPYQMVANILDSSSKLMIAVNWHKATPNGEKIVSDVAEQEEP
jgi:hypothetical protein